MRVGTTSKMIFDEPSCYPQKQFVQDVAEQIFVNYLQSWFIHLNKHYRKLRENT